MIIATCIATTNKVAWYKHGVYTYILSGKWFKEVATVIFNFWFLKR